MLAIERNEMLQEKRHQDLVNNKVPEQIESYVFFLKSTSFPLRHRSIWNRNF